jgi:Concanavalin A-like lectin/glucanases superfamily
MEKCKTLILIVSSFLFIISCNKDNKSGDNTLVVKPIQIMGNVKIPDIIPGDKIGSLLVSSGYKVNPVTDAPPHLNNKISGSNKYCIVETLPGTVQIHTILNNNKPFLYGLSINSIIGDQILFNEETTAIGLIFLHPLIVVSDPAKANVVVEKIKNSPSFSNLESEVLGILAQGSLYNMTPYIDVENLVNYKFVVAETISQLNDNTSIEQNGLQIIENQRIGNEIRFKIRNYRKRYSTIYAHKYINGQLVNTDIKVTNGNLGYGPFEWVSSGEFDWIHAWYSIFKLQPEDQITQDSDFFSVNIDDAQKIYIKCYGLGVAGGSFPAFGSEEFNRGLLAMSKTAVFDFIIPVIEVITGVQSIAKSGDLRGRTNDDPLKKLISRYFEKFKTASSFHMELMSATMNNNKSEIFRVFLNETKDFLLDEENVKLYLDIVKRKANLSAASLSDFKTALANYSKIKSAGDITGLSVNIAEAVYATLSSKWTTEFRMDIDGKIDLTNGLVAYFPFDGNVADASSNNNNGTIHGGISYSTDRNNRPGKACLFNGSDSYILVPPSPTLNSITTQTDTTFTCWFKTDNWNNIGGHISKNDNANNLHYRFLVNETGSLLQIEQLYANGIYSPLIANKWYHFAAVKTGNTSRIYLDGTLISETSMLSSPWATDYNTNLEIGRDAHGPVEYTRGIFDEIRIYNRSLTKAEIQMIMNF